MAQHKALNLGAPVAVFDMDGTLIDSMSEWRSLNDEFLLENNLPVPEELRGLTGIRSGRYCAEIVVKAYNLPLTADEIIRSNERKMYPRYMRLHEKPGACEYLKYLKSRGVRLCVATYTPSDVARHALNLRGMLGLFEMVTTPFEIGVAKGQSEFFHALAKRLNCEARDITVYEDTPAMLASARGAGCRVVGIKERVWAEEEAAARALSDVFIEDYAELIQGGDCL